jgi:hypothetical protein
MQLLDDFQALVQADAREVAERSLRHRFGHLSNTRILSVLRPAAKKVDGLRGLSDSAFWIGGLSNSADSAAKWSALTGSPADGRGDSPKPWCCRDLSGQETSRNFTVCDARRQFLGTAAANAARTMPDALRKSIFAAPFGCLVAVATHFVRFGDDHAFGGRANEALASLAIGGSITTALTFSMHS